MPDHILIIRIRAYFMQIYWKKVSLLTEFSLLKMESINWSGQLCCLQSWSCCCCKNVHLELCAHWARLTYIVQVSTWLPTASAKHFPRSSSKLTFFCKAPAAAMATAACWCQAHTTFLNWKEGFFKPPFFAQKHWCCVRETLTYFMVIPLLPTISFETSKMKITLVVN